MGKKWNREALPLINSLAYIMRVFDESFGCHFYFDSLFIWVC
jgi:hypothetical protein